MFRLKLLTKMQDLLHNVFQTQPLDSWLSAADGSILYKQGLSRFYKPSDVAVLVFLYTDHS